LTLLVPPPPAREHAGAAETAACNGVADPKVVMELLLGWLAEGYSWQVLTPAFPNEPGAVATHGSW
jgi:hypothetical protein